MRRGLESLLLAAALAAGAFGPAAQSQTWTPVSGNARDVAVGANGTAWVIGADARPGGFGIYRRDGEAWTNVPGGALRIAVDPGGRAWVVNSTQTLFRHDGAQLFSLLVGLGPGARLAKGSQELVKS